MKTLIFLAAFALFPAILTTGTAQVPPEQAIQVSVSGKVVDDETNEPVRHFFEQFGTLDSTKPGGIDWSWSQSSRGSSDSFSFLLRWSDGHRWRIVADGYLPQPVFHEAPTSGTVRPIVRLKRGRTVRGKVLDHVGKPVAGAGVFPIGPRYVNLAEGKAWSSQSSAKEVETRARPATTNVEGMFELEAGGATSIGISCVQLDAWSVPIAEKGDTVFQLPKAAILEIRLDILGATDGEISYQLVGHQMNGLESSRKMPLKNGETIKLAAVTPGRYQLLRWQPNFSNVAGAGLVLETKEIELEPGETGRVGWVREKGARLTGIVKPPAGTDLKTAVIIVQHRFQPAGDHPREIDIATATTKQDGTFETERIPPGRHFVVARSYRENGAILFETVKEIDVAADKLDQSIGEIILAPKVGLLRD